MVRVKQQEQVWVMDATNRVHVLWHAIHHPGRVIEQLAREIESLRAYYQVETIGMAFDSPSCFRRDLDGSYKAMRKDKDEGLKHCLAEAATLAGGFRSMACLAAEGFEADDILATIAQLARASGRLCVLVSPDKDLRQCLFPGEVTILKKFQANRWEESVFETAGSLTADLGFDVVTRWIDYQCLVGDPTDGVVGWEGVGEKTARQWLAKLSVDQLAQTGGEWLVDLNARQRRTRPSFVKRLPLIRQLVTLRTDVPHCGEWL